jgi:hypothetical protein
MLTCCLAGPSPISKETGSPIAIATPPSPATAAPRILTPVTPGSGPKAAATSARAPLALFLLAALAALVAAF